jgi:hypothetical protein
MWPWIKRWRDWAMHDLWPMHRTGPQPQALHYSYEKAGLTVHDQPVPWNAEAVLVEVRLRLPPTARQKNDFQLRLPGSISIGPEHLRKDEHDDCHRLTFRLPPLPHSVTAEVLWRRCHLGQMTLPVLSRDEFVQHLRLEMPTLFVRLGDQSVACQTFVSTQCQGLLASVVLLSPFSLLPLLDLGLSVEFRSERGSTYRVPAQLCSSQLAGRQALVTVVPRRFPRRIGAWSATWLLGEEPLVTQRVRAISQRQFQRSLRIADTRFVFQSAKSGVSVRRQVPTLQAGDRVGPCFLVASREPGMAGLCPLQVRAVVPGAVQQPLLTEQQVLVTDGPTVVAPGTLDAADLEQVTGFELRLKQQVLGVLSLSPAPSATFNGEGGFKPADQFLWSAAAEEELNERLARLLNEPRSGP